MTNIREEYTIEPYNSAHEQGAAALLESIAAEFEETIYAPGSKSITELAEIPGRSYWVVLYKDKVAGTVGIAMIAAHIAVLKGMMLHKDHRGSRTKLAEHMLRHAEEAVLKKGATVIYLGTMTQFKAAQRFYEKQGYEQIKEDELPVNFPANPVDKVFYMKALNI